MARVKKAVGDLRARIAYCSVKAAFAFYAAIAIIAAIALTAAFSVVASHVAESTVGDDSDAYSGTFVFDEASNSLVPAETLSWYEAPAFESLYGQDGTEAPKGESAGTGAVSLYVEGSPRADSKPIPLGNLPATVPDGTILDASWTASASDVHDDPLSFSEIAAYDAAERPARPGFDAALALAERLPDNAGGEKPIVSNVAYYVPYPDDSPAYRAVAWGYIASVPAVFVACLVVAGRLFYRNRIARPVAAMEEAAAKISDGDLDFNMEPQRNDELGRLCARFEDMRAELARSKSEMWRAAENRRRVNAAFAHDLRTPLTVVRGRAELIEMTADGKVKEAAAVIRRQAGRLAAFADSMSGVDSLEDAPLRKEALRASRARAVLARSRRAHGICGRIRRPHGPGPLHLLGPLRQARGLGVRVGCARGRRHRRRVFRGLFLTERRRGISRLLRVS